MDYLVPDEAKGDEKTEFTVLVNEDFKEPFNKVRGIRIHCSLSINQDEKKHVC